MFDVTRRQPINETMTLREAMDQLFDDAFTRPRGGSGVSVIPDIDLYQTADHIGSRLTCPA